MTCVGIDTDKPLDTFKDERGIIVDILENIDSVTIIHSYAGAIRGNHYHKETHQWTYIVSGKTRVVTQVNGATRGDVVESAGALIYHAPGTQHAFQAIEDTKWLVFTRGPRKGKDYESDTYRLEEPL